MLLVPCTSSWGKINLGLEVLLFFFLMKILREYIVVCVFQSLQLTDAVLKNSTKNCSFPKSSASFFKIYIKMNSKIQTIKDGDDKVNERSG